MIGVRARSFPSNSFAIVMEILDVVSLWHDPNGSLPGDGSVRRGCRMQWAKHRVGVIAGFLAFAVVAAACGGDDGGETAANPTTTVEAPRPKTTSAADATTPTTAGPQPISLAAWEALWADERAA